MKRHTVSPSDDTDHIEWDCIVTTSVQRSRRRNSTKLAVYLGASNSRRFPPQYALGHSAEGIRVKLLIAAIAILGLCLWGLWHEFF